MNHDIRCIIAKGFKMSFNIELQAERANELTAYISQPSRESYDSIRFISCFDQL